MRMYTELRLQTFSQAMMSWLREELHVALSAGAALFAVGSI